MEKMELGLPSQGNEKWRQATSLADARYHITTARGAEAAHGGVSPQKRIRNPRAARYPRFAKDILQYERVASQTRGERKSGM